MKYRAPDWYRDAKLGIMINWGPSAVPAYAPTQYGDRTDILREHDWQWYFRHTPHAQWYANGMRLADSDVRAYHNAHFGRHVAYERFARRFTNATADWSPDGWAEFFAEMGVRYVVMVSKHHDGYLLWPSQTRRAESFTAERDLVGMTAEAVRARNLRFGVSYSGQLDWSFASAPVSEFADLLLTPSTDEYAAHAERHFYELIERYKPDLLWNDIGVPAQISLRKLFSTYRNVVPEGVLNDRWRQTRGGARRILGADVIWRRMAEKARRAVAAGREGGGDGDVSTVEYGQVSGIPSRPWELVRGLGYSFGYNQEETKETTMSGLELIQVLADVVSRNGNLLISVGPDIHGDIPAVQKRPLAELGAWLSVHGEAIFGTRPWKQADAVSTDAVPLRFTSRENTLYVIALQTPPLLKLVIPDLPPAQVLSRQEPGTELGFEITILGSDREIDWTISNGNLEINIPGSFRPTGPIVFKLAWRGADREPDRFYTDVI